MKGIILAGGKATRLGPAASVVSKQLQRVGGIPMVNHAISYQMLTGNREIAIISTPQAIGQYEELFGDGSDVGLKLEYIVQDRPRGLADAFILGEKFLDGDSVLMSLGDNFLYGAGLTGSLLAAKDDVEIYGGGHIFGYHVEDPTGFGIIEYDKDGKTVLSIEEKPARPKSNWAAIGFYFFDHRAPEIAKQVKPSTRGEIEVTSVIEAYRALGELRSTKLQRGTLWADAGTIDELDDLNNWVRLTNHLSRKIVGSLEEIAFEKGWITTGQLYELGERYGKSPYGQYLIKLAEEAATR